MTEIGQTAPEILYIFQSIHFPRKLEFTPQKTNNEDLKGVTFNPETKYDAVFFFSDRSFWLVTPFCKI